MHGNPKSGEKPPEDLPLFDLNQGAARRTDPETSKAAARTVDVTALERLTLDALRKAPMTTQEIAWKVGRDRDSISPRMKRLVTLGLVEDSGERRVPSGKRKAAIVWRLVRIDL